MTDSSAHEQCAACGFDGAGYGDGMLTEAVRALGPRWRALLADAGPHLRDRPAPEVWSALEYAAHTRDIIGIHVTGVEQALTVDEPFYPGFDPGMVDAIAVAYKDADPADVGRDLDAHAARLAGLAEDATPAAWSRGLTVGGERTDVRRLLEHALHDALHHVGDVERGLASLRAAAR